MTPKHFFLWLAIVATLYWSIGAFVALIFAYVDFLFPEEFGYYGEPYSAIIRFSIASLVVIFPLFLFLMRLAHQDSRANPERRDLAVRRWLVYLTVFAAGASLVCDLVFLINSFLSGDLTTRFILKVLTVFVVAGLVFWYFLGEVRGRWEAKERQSTAVGSLAGAIVLLSIGAGFLIIGSPDSARGIRFDRERVNDLQILQSHVVHYWQSKGTLPPDLQALVDPISGLAELPADPVSEEPYTYRATGDLSFELCATFAEPSPEHAAAREVSGPAGERGKASWAHSGSQACFQRTIDPDFFPTDGEPVGPARRVPRSG